MSNSEIKNRTNERSGKSTGKPSDKVSINLNNKLVFIMIGLPGSGKTTLSKKLTAKLGTIHLSSDEIRKEVFNSSRHGEIDQDMVNEQRKNTYKIMYQRGIELVRSGKKVILDATHLELNKRKSVVDIYLQEIEMNQLCFIVLNPDVKTIDKRMVKIKKLARTQEIAEKKYQDWKRVVGYFIEDFKKGKLSWPEEGELDGVDYFNYKEVEYALAQRN
jgi:predicted kinase